MKNLIKVVAESKVGRTVATGVIGGATVFGLLTWNGGENLEAARGIVGQLINQIGILEGTIEDLETDISDKEDTIDENENKIEDLETEQGRLEGELRRANTDAANHLQSILNMVEDIEGINVSDIVVDTSGTNE